MYIKSIEITGLRGFAQTERLELGIPTNKPGSGLTILLGPNNAGKSTVIEAFTALSRKKPPSLTEGRRNKKNNERVSLRITNMYEQTKELRTVEAGGSETTWMNEVNILPEPSNIFVLPSRRTFNPYFGGGNQVREAYVSSLELPTFRVNPTSNFSVRLFNAQKNKEAFDKVLGRVLDPVPDWKIDQSDNGTYYLKFQYGDSYHSSDGLGDGILSILFIVDALYDSKEQGEIIVIDEPELSLHPSLQKKLFALLADYAKTRQIIYATHSPYFIEWDAIFNGAKIVRVHKKDNRTTFSTLSQETVESLKGLLKNRNNPHILGLDAREIFFLEDQIVLVEGQEDVVLYKGEIAQQLNINIQGDFFGWGVGGASNMETIAKMLSELGFLKVVGILDKNEESKKSGLEANFPKFKFFVIPANDVRSKRAVKQRDAVEGLLNEEGKIRDEYQEPLQELFQNVNKALLCEESETLIQS